MLFDSTESDKNEKGNTNAGNARKCVWDVQQLPADLKPVSRPSKIIERLLVDKNVSHTKAINNMKAKLIKVNKDFEDSYRKKADNLKLSLKQCKSETEEFINNNMYEPNDNMIFENIQFANTVKTISENEIKCIGIIDEFQEYMMDLERKRTGDYKIIYSGSYSEISEISHILPFEIQEYFELEITNFNEILLQNYRGYSEVNTLLRREIVEDKLLWLQKINRNKEKWTRYLQKNGYSQFIPNILDSLFESNENVFSNTLNKINNISRLDQIVSDLLINVDHLDIEVTAALKKCKFAILKIFYGEYDELHNLNTDIIPENITSFETLCQYRGELEKTIHYACNEGSDEDDLDEIQQDWKLLIDSLRARIEFTKTFLENVSCLWDVHFNRVSHLREVVTQDLSNTMFENDLDMQNEEIKVNIVYDGTRTGAIREQAIEFYKSVVMALTANENIYFNHQVKEKEVIENYHRLSGIEADILMMEITRFLAVHPRELTANPGIMGTRGSRLNLADIKKKPPHIKYLEYRLNSLDNWIYGLWETLEANAVKCKQEIAQKAEEWSNVLNHRIKTRFQQRISVYKLRYYRIWMNVFQMRNTELKTHSLRKDRHMHGIEKVLEKLSQEVHVVENDSVQLMKDYNEQINILEERLFKSKTMGYLNSSMQQMEHLKKQYLQKITERKEQYLKLSNVLLNGVLYGNICFLKNIRMFGECGNFHSDELDIFSSEITQNEKEFVKTAGTVQKDGHSQFKKIEKMINDIPWENKIFKTKISNLEVEVTFSDTIKKKYSDLTSEIKRIVYDVRFKRNAIKDNLKNFDNQCAKLVNDVTNDSMQTIKEKYFECLKMIKEFKELLNRSEINSGLKSDTDNAMKSQQRIIETTVAEETSGQSSNKSSNKSSIESSLKLRGNGIIKQLHELLNKYNQTVTNIGKEYYNSQNRMNMFVQTESAFNSEITAKFRYYQLQADAVWIEEAIEYVGLSVKFHKNALRFCSDTLKNYRTVKYTEFTNTHKEITDILSATEIGGNDNVTAIHRKLKPLHGHPNNQRLFELLTEEFTKAIVACTEKLDDRIGNYKEEHCNLKDDILDTYSERVKILTQIKENNEIPSMNSSIFPTILNTFTNLQNILMNEEIEISTEFNEIDQVASEKLVEYKTNITLPQIPEEYLTRFSVSTFDHSSSSYLFDMDDKECEADYTIDQLSTNLNEDLEKHIAEIEHVENTVAGDSKKWMDIWNNNINIIHNLYTVKYDSGKKEDNMK